LSQPKRLKNPRATSIANCKLSDFYETFLGNLNLSLAKSKRDQHERITDIKNQLYPFSHSIFFWSNMFSSLFVQWLIYCLTYSYNFLVVKRPKHATKSGEIAQTCLALTHEFSFLIGSNESRNMNCQRSFYIKFIVID
jgi:hypothetical protein